MFALTQTPTLNPVHRYFSSLSAAHPPLVVIGRFHLNPALFYWANARINDPQKGSLI